MRGLRGWRGLCSFSDLSGSSRWSGLSELGGIGRRPPRFRENCCPPSKGGYVRRQKCSRSLRFVQLARGLISRRFRTDEQPAAPAPTGRRDGKRFTFRKPTPNASRKRPPAAHVLTQARKYPRARTTATIKRSCWRAIRKWQEASLAELGKMAIYTRDVRARQTGWEGRKEGG